MERTATQTLEEGMRLDLRRRRAQMLAANVMQILEKYLCEHDERRNARRDAYYDLLEAFHRAGAEVLTDYDRQQAGLPPRDELGWTADELRALERQRLELMMRPLL